MFPSHRIHLPHRMHPTHKILTSQSLLRKWEESSTLTTPMLNKHTSSSTNSTSQYKLKGHTRLLRIMPFHASLSLLPWTCPLPQSFLKKTRSNATQQSSGSAVTSSSSSYGIMWSGPWRRESLGLLVIDGNRQWSDLSQLLLDALLQFGRWLWRRRRSNIQLTTQLTEGILRVCVVFDLQKQRSIMYNPSP